MKIKPDNIINFSAAKNIAHYNFVFLIIEKLHGAN